MPKGKPLSPGQAKKNYYLWLDRKMATTRIRKSGVLGLAFALSSNGVALEEISEITGETSEHLRHALSVLEVEINRLSDRWLLNYRPGWARRTREVATGRAVACPSCGFHIDGVVRLTV
jgi:hypothetical protein